MVNLVVPCHLMVLHKLLQYVKQQLTSRSTQFIGPLTNVEKSTSVMIHE